MPDPSNSYMNVFSSVLFLNLKNCWCDDVTRFLSTIFMKDRQEERLGKNLTFVQGAEGVKTKVFRKYLIRQMENLENSEALWKQRWMWGGGGGGVPRQTRCWFERHHAGRKLQRKHSQTGQKETCSLLVSVRAFSEVLIVDVPWLGKMVRCMISSACWW